MMSHLVESCDGVGLKSGHHELCRTHMPFAYILKASLLPSLLSSLPLLVLSFPVSLLCSSFWGHTYILI